MHRSIVSALGFSTLQEKVFNIEGFTYGGWMTFITYVTYSICGTAETVITRGWARQGALKVGKLVAPSISARHACRYCWWEFQLSHVMHVGDRPWPSSVCAIHSVHPPEDCIDQACTRRTCSCPPTKLLANAKHARHLNTSP